MAQSYIEYNQGLSDTTFAVPFKYLSIDDVNVIGYDGTSWTSLPIAEDGRDSSANTVTLTSAPSAYTKIRVFRQSSTTALIDFQNGSRLSESDLDTAYQQSLFVAQEVSEDANTNQFEASKTNSILSGTNLSNFASDTTNVGDGSTVEFGLNFAAQTSVPEAYVVSIDGVIQTPTEAYSVSISPSQITFTSAPPVDANIVVVTAASAASATSVDDSTIGLTSANQIELKDGGITPSKLSTGGLSWEQNGKVTINGRSDTNESTLALKAGLGNSSSIIQFSDPLHGDIGQILYDHGGNYMRFKTNDAERMRITSDGKLLVGTGVGNLNNSGETGAEIFPQGKIQVARSDAPAADFNRLNSSGSLIDFRKDGNVKGSITITSSTTSYNTSSDYRLKEDIIELDDSIDRLKALKPCNFAWKADGSRVDGFIAHEAQEVVPEAVTGTKDAVDEDGNPEYQGIDQAKLVPLLTKALQEALTKIETLEARVEALENA